VLPNSEYESDMVALRRGDVLALYTDGIVEAESPTGEQYSATRLAKIVSSHLQESASELIESIYASVTQFQGTTAQTDDMTLVVLKAL
jgi:phosphoserine phosphatase RsbU/P